MRLSDDEWVARARARVARGEPWDGQPGEAFAEFSDAPAESLAPAPGVGRTLRCPSCDAHPPLEPVRRWEAVSVTPLLRCPSCYGFWAAGDALAHGVRDADDDHPSFVAMLAPARCRLCLGYLDPGGTCRKCGRSLPLLDCPSCAHPMTRTRQNGVTLDACEPCHGLWFDVGEIGRVYGLQPVQGFSASPVDDHAADHEPPGWLIMLQTILRLVAPYL